MSKIDFNKTKQSCINKFIEHPRESGETYCQHFTYATKLGLKLLGNGIIAIVHGLCPFLFTKTVSTNVTNIYTDLWIRKQQMETFQQLNAKK